MHSPAHGKRPRTRPQRALTGACSEPSPRFPGCPVCRRTATTARARAWRIFEAARVRGSARQTLLGSLLPRPRSTAPIGGLRGEQAGRDDHRHGRAEPQLARAELLWVASSWGPITPPTITAKQMSATSGTCHLGFGNERNERHWLRADIFTSAARSTTTAMMVTTFPGPCTRARPFALRRRRPTRGCTMLGRSHDEPMRRVPGGPPVAALGPRREGSNPTTAFPYRKVSTQLAATESHASPKHPCPEARHLVCAAVRCLDIARLTNIAVLAGGRTPGKRPTDGKGGSLRRSEETPAPGCLQPSRSINRTDWHCCSNSTSRRLVAGETAGSSPPGQRDRQLTLRTVADPKRRPDHRWCRPSPYPVIVVSRG